MKLKSCRRCQRQSRVRYRAREDSTEMLLCSACAAVAWQLGFTIEALGPRAEAKLRREHSTQSGRNLKSLRR